MNDDGVCCDGVQLRCRKGVSVLKDITVYVAVIGYAIAKILWMLGTSFRREFCDCQ